MHNLIGLGVTFFVLLQIKSGGVVVFCRLCIKRLRFPILFNDVPEVFLSIVDKLEVDNGFFPIPSRYCWVVLI